MKKFEYKYPRVAITVDCVIIRKNEILLIKRKNPPFQNQWALPGGFHDCGETVEESALRELEEETNLTNVNIKQIGVFSKPDRDPREQVISIAFLGNINKENKNIKLIAKDDAIEINWFKLNELPALAFDHRDIVNKATNKN